EVRLSNVARSSGWILTEYNNENSPSTFYSVGAEVARDTTAPTLNPTATEGTLPANQFFNTSNDTVYYNPTGTGTFTIQSGAADTGSGLYSVALPAIAATGFTHTAITRTATPWDSNTYTFSSTNTTAPAAQTVTATDNHGNTATATITFVRDATAPAAFSLSAPAASAKIRNGATVSAAPTDASAGVAQVEFRYCAGATCTYAGSTLI